MKKIYMTPEMEILDTEMEGFLASSRNSIKEAGGSDSPDARRFGGDFDDFDDYEEDEY